MRYLGGGIGHLEQFPPANNDNEVMYEYEDTEDEVAGDDGGIGDIGEDGEDGDEESDEDTEDDAGKDYDAESGEYLDPGDSSDEDTGNSY